MIVPMPDLMYNGVRQKPQDVYLGPNNSKQEPCNTCENFDPCANNETDCSAMRSWCNTGNYKLEDIMKSIR
jgi:hypothetical protein